VKLSGLFASVSTPFDHCGEIYPSKIRQNVSLLDKTGLAGYLVCGAAGEGAALLTDERTQVWEEVAGAATQGKTLLAGCSADGIRAVLELTRRAAGAGYRAAVIAPPSFDRRQCGSFSTKALFFRSIADQSTIPVIVLHEPDADGFRFGIEELAILAEHPNIAALCLATEDAVYVEQCARMAADRCQVLAGSGSCLYPQLARGATAAITDLASAAPYFCLSIEEAIRTRELEAAQRLQERAAVASKLVTTRFAVPGLKYALDLQGYYGGPPRLPLFAAGDETRKEIRVAFHGLSS
jgi:4-hydroxy-2-oxoglutarate aldolase